MVLSEENRLKISQAKEAKLKETPLQKMETLIRKHKFARTEEDKIRAESELKKYALELYKQDPHLLSLSIRNKEIAEHVRAIVKEEHQKKLTYSFER